jgi:CRP-like cAMP-binding protein
MIGAGLEDRQVLLRRVAARWSDFGRLSPADIAAVDGLCSAAAAHIRSREITAHLQGGPHIILEGWACQMRPQPKRRRQIFGFFVPGDVIGSFWPTPEVRFYRVLALTRVYTVPASLLLTKGADGVLIHHALIEAAQIAEHNAQRWMFSHMERLGGRDAYRALAHLLLEFNDRLEVMGLAEGGRFALPIGQRVLAEALGLSLAHTNLTFRRMTSDGLLQARSGEIQLLQPDRLADLAAIGGASAPKSAISRGQSARRATD